MIKIERDNLSFIAEEYLKKLQKKEFYKSGKLVRTYFIENFEHIVLSKPEDFSKIITEFNNKFNQPSAESFDDFKKYMGNQYKVMRDKYGYWLLKELDIRVCPYCNRQYTFTIEKNKISPEFDHYYPKSKYPYLALSFFNLIPSCSTCNYSKTNNEIDINPYIKGFDDSYKFMIKTKKGKEDSLNWILENDIKIDFTDLNKNIKEFALKELYNEHIDYVEEIINKAQAYNSSYYDSLIDSFKGLGKQSNEIDRFVWGNYFEKAEHEKRILSKLTSDILKQLKIK